MKKYYLYALCLMFNISNSQATNLLEDLQNNCTRGFSCYYNQGSWHQTETENDFWGISGFAVGIVGVGAAILIPVIERTVDYFVDKYYPIGTTRTINQLKEKIQDIDIVKNNLIALNNSIANINVNVENTKVDLETLSNYIYNNNRDNVLQEQDFTSYSSNYSLQ